MGGGQVVCSWEPEDRVRPADRPTTPLGCRSGHHTRDASRFCRHDGYTDLRWLRSGSASAFLQGYAGISPFLPGAEQTRAAVQREFAPRPEETEISQHILEGKHWQIRTEANEDPCTHRVCRTGLRREYGAHSDIRVE